MVTQSFNDNAICRKAPATPGLLKTYKTGNILGQNFPFLSCLYVSSSRKVQATKANKLYLDAF